MKGSARKQRVRYRFDALGRRVERNVGFGKERTEFSYDGQDVVMDDDIVSGITKYQNGVGIDNKLTAKTGSTVKYFLADHLGSTNGLTSSTGSLTASQSYDSFGNPTNANFPTRYQFTGREFDNFTGLQYSRARFYDPRLGRFMSEDPIGFSGGDINLYGYVWNDPLMFVDPLGLYGDERPFNPLRNPFDSSHWVPNAIANTVSDLLSLDDLADAFHRLGNHGLSSKDRASAGAEAAARTAFNVGGGGLVCRFLGKAAKWVRYGDELPIGPDIRIAPFGNRTGHRTGKWPHYHRRGPKNKTGPMKGQPRSGQGKGRHRPWDRHKDDESFWDRF